MCGLTIMTNPQHNNNPADLTSRVTSCKYKIVRVLWIISAYVYTTDPQPKSKSTDLTHVERLALEGRQKALKLCANASYGFAGACVRLHMCARVHFLVCVFVCLYLLLCAYVSVSVCLFLCACACTCPVRPKTLNLCANTSYKRAGVCVCAYVCVRVYAITCPWPSSARIDDLTICSSVFDASGQVMLRTHTHTPTHTHIQIHTYTTAHTHRCCYITSSECSISWGGQWLYDCRHAYVYTDTNTCAHTHAHTHTCTHMHAHIHTLIHIHTYTHTHTHTHTYTHTRTNTHTHAHIYAHAYTHTSTHTHTHIHMYI